MLDAGSVVGFQALSYILNQTDYYAFYTCSMFSGLVADYALIVEAI